MGYDPNSPYGQGQPQQPNSPFEQPPTQYTPPPAYGQGQQPYGQPPPGYGQQQYRGAPPVPGYAPQQAPRKSSRRWLWITLAIIGAIVVLGCAGCAIASVAGVGFFAKTVLGPTTTANAYYQAIKDQDYARAYTYIDTSRASSGQLQQETEQAFVALAQLDDRTRGPVTSFSQQGVSVNNDTATVTMSVTRNGSSYTVHLQMKQEGNDWKITGLDNI